MFKKMKLRTKIYGLIVLINVVFIGAMILAGLKLTSAIHEARNNSARAATEVGYGLLDYYVQEHKEGRLSLEEAQKNALEVLASIRYEGIEYFWVNDTTLPYPTMVMHSVNASLNGQVMDKASYNVAMGRDQNLFQAMTEICQRDGEGYVDYLWPRPGETVPAPKVSYVKLLKEWDWIIGTGVYVDNVNAQIRAVVVPITIAIAVMVVVIAVVAVLLVSRAITGPIRRTAAMLKDISEGEGDLTKRLVVGGNDEIGEMARYFNQFVEKLQGIIRKIADNAQTLANSSTELSATATQLASGAEETTSQSATVASAAEEMATNMNNMAASSEEMSANVKTVASAVE
ncbi:MAG: methyl-accepting chemotaxis protein, partial [Phycisphaerae bacterium]|nr:methyl-accepting chemotaxis protein [Phycisphaerae bacterium]